MKGTKHRMVWAASVLALPLGWWLAGVFNLYLLGLSLEGVPPWNSYGPYVMALGRPELVPFAGKVRMAGMLGFGTALLAWVAIATLLLRGGTRVAPSRRRAEPMRFAPGSWIEKAGYEAMGLGRPLWGRRRERCLGASGHVLVVAPVDERWSEAFVLPNLLTWEGPALVVDRDGRAWHETSGHRASLGEVRVFAPFSMGTPTARWNPLDDLPRHEPDRSMALQAMARTIYADRRGHRSIPHDVVDAFLALTLFVLDDRSDAQANGLTPSAVSLGDVWALCAQAGDLRKAQLKRLADKPFISVGTRDRIERLLAMTKRDLDALMSRTAEPLRFLSDPRVRETIAGNDIDLVAWAEGSGSLYVAWPEEASHAGAWLVSYLLERALVALRTRRARATALCVLEGPATIGSLPSLERSLYEAKTRGVRFLQRTNGGREWLHHYGEAGSKRVLGGFDLRVFAGPVVPGDVACVDDLFAFPSSETTRFDHRRWPALSGYVATQRSETLVALQRGIELAMRGETLRYDQDPRLAARRLPPVTTMPSPGDHVMPSNTLKTVGATAALALAASAPAACSQADPSTGMTEAQLVSQAKKDGLTIEQERQLRHMTGRPDPGYHFDGYSEKRVETTLGRNTFGFPMNLYSNQTGPDFQGGVSLTLRWPNLEPFTPGAKYDPAYSKAYVNESVRFQPTYVDRVPIESVPGLYIQPSPNDHDSPITHIDLRLRGEDRYGLTPYYADIQAIARYLGEDGEPASRESAIAAGDDWFLAYDDKGRISTFIRCDSREIPGALLKNGRLEDLPPGEPRGICHHQFAIPSLSLSIDVTYMRAYLPDWKKIEDRVRNVFADGMSHGDVR